MKPEPFDEEDVYDDNDTAPRSEKDVANPEHEATDHEIDNS